jgi:hypothetical protein
VKRPRVNSCESGKTIYRQQKGGTSKGGEDKKRSVRGENGAEEKNREKGTGRSGKTIMDEKAEKEDIKQVQ